MNRVGLVILFVASFAAANETPSIRVCIGALENRSSYQLPIDKLKVYFVSELSHKNIKGISIAGEDAAAEMAKNNCDYLVRGEFSDYASLKPGEVLDIGGIVVDGRKRFILRFSFDLKRSVDEKPVYSHQEAIIDKNPKTCADDHMYEAARSIRDYFKKR